MVVVVWWWFALFSRSVRRELGPNQWCCYSHYYTLITYYHFVVYGMDAGMPFLLKKGSLMNGPACRSSQGGASLNWVCEQCRFQPTIFGLSLFSKALPPPQVCIHTKWLTSWAKRTGGLVVQSRCTYICSFAGGWMPPLGRRMYLDFSLCLCGASRSAATGKHTDRPSHIPISAHLMPLIRSSRGLAGGQ